MGLLIFESNLNAEEWENLRVNCGNFIIIVRVMYFQFTYLDLDSRSKDQSEFSSPLMYHLSFPSFLYREREVNSHL